MTTSNHRRLMAIGSGAVLIATLQGCHRGLIVPAMPGTLVLASQHREAEGGGFVTVDYGVVPGVMPDSNMSAGPEMSVAWFSNRGEGGKKEKRYGWKRHTQAKYELVLSHDGSGRTKWTMREHRIVSGRPYSMAFKSGHLRPCTAGPWHPHPPTSVREVGFRDCQPGIPYDPAETASHVPSAIVHFAINTTEGDGRFPPQNAPGWISCDGGCCSLGQ